MAPSSLTLNYGALLSTTLMNYRAKLADNISLMNALMYFLMKKSSGGYKEVSDIGERCAVPLMYAVGSADSYSGYDALDTTPMDGITTAFYDWCQAAAPIAISGKEKKQNTGEERLINLLESKIKQAEIGIKEWFGKALIQGNGPNSATAITTPWTSPTNGSTFIDPLPKMVAYNPAASVSVGNINQLTYDWWRNQYTASSATTFVTFLAELRHLHNTCGKWGERPTLHLTDQLTYELYEKALAAYHHNDQWQKADIPFDNIAFKGKPVTWDDLVPDVKNGTITSIPVAASGTWFMLNTDHLGIQVHKGTNFSNGEFVRPENQDAEVAQILWLGALTCDNRRVQGVLGGVATTTAS